MAPTRSKTGQKLPTMEEVFRLRLQRIEERAEAVGGMSAICESVGASPYTPRRWRSKTPYTVLLVDKLEEALAEREAQAAQVGKGRHGAIERKERQLAKLREQLLADPNDAGGGRLMARIDKLAQELAQLQAGGDA